jgi:hypothetical protein
MNIFILLSLFSFTLGNNQVEIKQDDYCAQIKFYNPQGAIVNNLIVNNIYGYKVAQQGKYLYVLNEDGISIYDEQSKLHKRINDRGMFAVSSKDEYLVCVNDNIVRIYDFCRARLQPCEEKSKPKGLLYIRWSVEIPSSAIRQLVFSPDNKYLGVMARNNFSLVSLDKKQIIWNKDFIEPLVLCKITDDRVILVTENRSELNGKVLLYSLTGELLQELNFYYQQYDEQIQDIEILPEGVKAKTHLREWTLGESDENGFQRREHRERKDYSSFLCEPSALRDKIFMQESIPWPLGPTDSLHPIGNNWFEFQDYGGTPYFHPGVDILSPEQPGVPVYAVKHGFVKAWLSTGGTIYWRFGIADSSLSYTDSCNGYLYAHIDSARYHANIGDTVEVGDLIGYLVYWPVDPRTNFPTQQNQISNNSLDLCNVKKWCGVDSIHFHHCHFGKIKDRGNTWTTADWAFIFNPQILVTPNQDTMPPVFENALTNQKFAFARNSASTYLSPNSLNGAVDIIAKIYDKVNVSTGDSVWDRLVPLKIEYEIRGQDSSVPRKISFSFSHRVPTSSSLVSVVYKQDNTCGSQGDYENRDYYFIITNTDGDSVIESSDAQMSWQTTNFPNGNYWVKVYAYDVQNVSVCSMQVTVANNPGIEEQVISNRNQISLRNGLLFNALGQRINANKLKPGIYFYYKNGSTHKVLIMKTIDWSEIMQQGNP